MNFYADFQGLLEFATGKFWLITLSSTRILLTFMMMPLFSQDTVPALPRNAIAVSFALLAVGLGLPETIPTGPNVHAPMFLLLLKEALIGCTIGLVFGSILWAFETAGHILDTKAGTTMGQVTDPLSGVQTPLTAAFLGRMANFAFMFSGGFLLLIGTLFESFAVWPPMALTPVAERGALVVFESEFGRFMVITIMLAAPILVVLLAVDGVLGLVNRYAPSLNLFSLAGSLKTYISTLMVTLLLASYLDYLVQEVQARPAMVMRALGAIFGR